MNTSSGRTGRIICFVLSILLLVVAVFLLTDAVQVDTEPEATKLIVLAQVLGTGSVTLMIGALVWTLAARNGSEQRSPDRQWSASPQAGAAHHPQAGYGGAHPQAGSGAGPAQEAWVPPPDQAPRHSQPDQAPGHGQPH